MEDEPEVIRDQMQETRTALTEKLDTLQQKVADTVESITTPMTETVQTVKDAVSDTVETVKDSVSDAAESVKETFNVKRQVENHPWPMVLGGVAAGFVLGRMLPSPIEAAREVISRTDSVAATMSQTPQRHNGAHHAAEVPRQESAGEQVMSQISNAVKGELGKLAGLGVSIGVGLLRDVLTQSMQGEVGNRVREMLDDVTHKLGGKPISEPILGEQTGNESREGANSASATGQHIQGQRRW